MAFKAPLNTSGSQWSPVSDLTMLLLMGVFLGLSEICFLIWCLLACVSMKLVEWLVIDSFSISLPAFTVICAQ